MKDTALYEEILGLKKLWHVTKVDLSMESEEVLIHVEAEETAWGCPSPTCSQRMHVHSWTTRRWRHLNTCQLQTVIEAKVTRVKCPEHGTLMVTVPWAEPYGRFTAMFERVAIMLMLHCSISAAAKHLHLSWDEVDYIKERAVKRGLERRVPVPARAVCIDEKSVGKGQDYVTIVTRGPHEGAPFVDFIADGREQSALDAYWKLESSCPLERIGCASMDMWRPFINSASAVLPLEAQAITHDPSISSSST